MNFDPIMAQKVGQIMTAIKDVKDVRKIIETFKQQGLTPQSAEQMLCIAFPQIKEIKEQMNKSGLSPKAFLVQTAQMNNVSEEDLNKMLGGMFN